MALETLAEVYSLGWRVTVRRSHKRSGDPAVGRFNDAVVLKTFGDVPDRLDDL
jgi:hypothetical protein